MTAGTRLLVDRAIDPSFVGRLVASAESYVLGDPLDPATTMGPLISRRHQERVLEYIRRGVADGARRLCGGTSASSSELAHGNFVSPTIFTDVTSPMCIAQEEIFGPVLSISPFSDEADAIRVANDSTYGLASAVWTQNIDRAFA